MPFTSSNCKTNSCLKSVLKTFIFGLFLIGTLSSNARNFYFSSSSGNDGYGYSEAQNQSSPWRSLSKLNSIFSSLTGGDIIYFKAGDVFYGSITANQSGSAGNPILFTSYGSGNKPLISGFTTINNWSNIGNNIYQAYVPGASNTLNLVSINGVPQQLGRYPNFSTTSDPYLYLESSSGNSITDNQGLSTNWTGASVVIRQRRWLMNKYKITGQSGGRITYDDPQNKPSSAGFGYFIINDPRTLDKFGEWYFNPSNKNLQVHFGGNSPSNFSIKVSTIDKLVDLSYYRYISIQNLAFEGANVIGLDNNYGSDITIKQCDFNQMGKDGITISGTANTLLDGVNMNYVLNNGINLLNDNANNTTVRNCNVKNIAMLPGMTGNDDGNGIALSVHVNSGALIEYNNVVNIGYNAIEFQGNNVKIRYNYVDNYCNNKDDGGGIYTYGNGYPYVNREIYNNIVLNGVGASYGTAGKTPEAEGIYMDRGTEGVNIHDNSVAHMGRSGLLMNSIQNIQATNNTVYDTRWSIEFSRFGGDQPIKNNSIKSNIFYQKTADQNAFNYKNFALYDPVYLTIQQAIAAIGPMDNNIYGNINQTPIGYYYSNNAGGALIWPSNMTLAAWKAWSNQDGTSILPVKTPASINDVRFEYNSTNAAKTITLDANYVDVDKNSSYNGSITLQPYTSKILIKNGPSTGTTPPPPTTNLQVNASAPGFNCAGGLTSININGSGGSSPYAGTGNFSTNAGKGSIKISFPTSNSIKSSVIYSSIGNIVAGKTYSLNFTVIASNANRSLKAWLRSSSTSAPLAIPYTDQFLNSARNDYKLIFTPTSSDPNGRIDIEIPQNSGTTYIDNIAFFESTLEGNLISNNYVSNGQFETDLTGMNVWSSNNNQDMQWDNTGKINSTNYYTVTDSKGSKATIGVNINQPATTLTASVRQSGNILIVTASGGAYPYTGTGYFNGNYGFNSFTVSDANGCSDETNINLSSAARSNTSNTLAENALGVQALGNTTLQISSYPNPTTTNFSLLVQGGSAEKIGITVMGSDSRIVYQTTGSTNNTFKFGDNFAPGLYIIKVQQGSTLQTLKIIKGN